MKWCMRETFVRLTTRRTATMQDRQTMDRLQPSSVSAESAPAAVPLAVDDDLGLSSDTSTAKLVRCVHWHVTVVLLPLLFVVELGPDSSMQPVVLQSLMSKSHQAHASCPVCRRRGCSMHSPEKSLHESRL
jgi:hypothetical protein